MVPGSRPAEAAAPRATVGQLRRPGQRDPLRTVVPVPRASREAAHDGEPQVDGPPLIAGRSAVRAGNVPQPSLPREGSGSAENAPPAEPRSCLSLLSQVRDSIAPLNQCPAGHLILALSAGPSLELMVNWRSTSAGSPHLTAPSRSRKAGQSRNIIVVSSNHKVWCMAVAAPALARRQRRAPGWVSWRLPGVTRRPPGRR